MQRRDRNIAYDFSLFEDKAAINTSTAEKKQNKIKTRHKDNVVKMTDKQLYKSRRRKYTPLQIIGTVFACICIVSVVSVMISSQVKITELTEQISKANTELSEKQSEYTQLSVKAQSALSLQQVNSYATEVMGMVPTEDYQIQYIKTESGDHGEVLSKGNTFVANVRSIVSSLIS